MEVQVQKDDIASTPDISNVSTDISAITVRSVSSGEMPSTLNVAVLTEGCNSLSSIESVPVNPEMSSSSWDKAGVSFLNHTLKDVSDGEHVKTEPKTPWEQFNLSSPNLSASLEAHSGSSKAYNFNLVDTLKHRINTILECNPVHQNDRWMNIEDANILQTDFKAEPSVGTGVASASLTEREQILQTGWEQDAGVVGDGTDGARLACPHCDAKLMDELQLIAHIRRCLTERPHGCPHCDAKFSHKTHLNNHIRIHTGERPFSCSYCDRRFSRKEGLQRHVRTHTGQRPYGCQLCEAKFAQQGQLTTHLRKHAGIRPHGCPHCESSFPSNTDLIRHIRTHTGERSFHCPHCQLRFSQQGHLSSHIFTHTGERPFSCEQCDAKFTRRGHLNTHMLTHLAVRPFGCPHCETRFNQRHHLITHIRTHTGERPYDCPLCEAKFIRRDQLTRHLSVHC